MPRDHSRRGVIGASRFAVLAALVAAACNTDKILQVEDPDVARPSSLTGVAALPSIRAGAIGDFANGYNGNGSEGQVTLAALLTDEYINTETFPTRIEIDRRNQQINNGTLSGLFYDLQRARVSTDRADIAYKAFDANNSAHAEVLGLEALTFVFMAEDYCGAVPLSSYDLTTGIFTYGAALTTVQLLDSAIAKSTQALAVTGLSATSNFRYLAQVAKGRALLDKGQYAAAATAVAGVPTSFQYVYVHSATTTRQNNATWGLTVSVARFGVANLEGVNGLPFQSEGNSKVAGFDPRVADTLRGGTHVGFDGATQQWIQQKYPLRTSPIVIADGVEARLIEAEAALNTPDAAGALVILNALRSNAALLAQRGYPAGSLAPLPLAGTTAGQVDQLFKERAYWLFLTAHRLGDMRRLIRQYGRDRETVFPTGNYFKGSLYGTDVNSPIPQTEQNNPSFIAASCVLTTA